MLGVQRGAQLCSAESIVRSLVECGALEWGLQMGASIGRQWSSSWAAHALDGTGSKRDTPDGVEGSVSPSILVHKTHQQESLAHAVPRCRSASPASLAINKERTGTSCPSLSY